MDMELRKWAVQAALESGASPEAICDVASRILEFVTEPPPPKVSVSGRAKWLTDERRSFIGDRPVASVGDLRRGLNKLPGPKVPWGTLRVWLVRHGLYTSIPSNLDGLQKARAARKRNNGALRIGA